MQAVNKDLMAMKVTELKELAARGEALSGNKAWLRRRLHAAIVRAHLEARAEEQARIGHAPDPCKKCNGCPQFDSCSEAVFSRWN